MSLLSTTEPPPPRRTPLIILVLVVLLAAGGALAYWLLTRTTIPAQTPKAKPTIRPTPRPLPSATPAPTPQPWVSVKPRPSATPKPAPLVVESDVPGARVFVDRKFAGNTPVEVRDVTPGTHRLNVSVDGYDMHGEDIEIGDEPLRISVRFREVKLDESLSVIHKHGVGSCQGKLVATTQGLAYQPSSGSDSFQTAFAELERFETDYLKKNLRITLRGGRTYNFTIEGQSADPLLVFQKKVDAARKRLAAGS